MTALETHSVVIWLQIKSLSRFYVDNLKVSPSVRCPFQTMSYKFESFCFNTYMYSVARSKMLIKFLFSLLSTRCVERIGSRKKNNRDETIENQNYNERNLDFVFFSSLHTVRRLIIVFFEKPDTQCIALRERILHNSILHNSIKAENEHIINQQRE